MVQVAVEITDGCKVTFIEPIKAPTTPGAFWLNAYRGIVTQTINFCNAKIYLIEVPNRPEFRVPAWRIIEFTFGGVWMPNHKFSQQKVDQQLRQAIKAKK